MDLKIDARLLQPDTLLMTTLIGGEGNAVGDATLVDAEIFSRLVDLGSVAIAFGSASFAATAVSDGNLAFTTTETFAEVAGADFVFTFTEKTSENDFVDGALVARETSKVSFVAVDFEDFDLPEGPVLVSTTRAEYLDCEGSDGFVEQIEGNVAQLSVDAAATSAATQVDVASSVLTVQDQLSSVSALASSAFADASFS